MNDNENISLDLPDGSSRAVPKGSVVRELVGSIFGQKAADGLLGVRVGDELIDLQSKVTSGGKIKLVYLKDDSPEARAFYRHSFSHVLAQAVRRLFPGVKLAIGPATAEGFYYDFDVAEPFTPEDLEKISAEMAKIVKEDYPFERQDVSLDEARKILSSQGEVYKLELLEEFAGRGEQISFYKDGDFLDMCRGPHVRATSAVKAFKLLDVAGAYWRGDEKRKMLQRIYGTAFLKETDLKDYLWQLEEAKKRDHRRLGRELDLFSINHEAVGGGLILWHPKGGLIRHLVEEHCKDRHIQGGYDFVYTPHIGRAQLWQTSGHLEFYKENMYAPIDIEGQEYYLKPMNCPFHVHIFKSSIRSYRDLPLRFAEWGTVYRFERSGTLHGLTRVRGFTQDDAHLFCRPDQMPQEIDQVLQFSIGLLRDFGLTEFHLLLSTRPEKRVGSEENWDAAEQALKAALDRSGLPYSVNEGDGAFYGPKIDIQLKDALSRPWQLSTIQFDFNLPERFDLNFIGEDGHHHRPFMVHRALLGSMERFFAVLLEHHGGNFPVWLSPVQVMILPIAERHQSYAEQLEKSIREAGLRVVLDASSNTLNYRIRNAQNQKVPFMVVVGDKEVEANQVSVRLRNGQPFEDKTLSGFLSFAQSKVAAKEAL